MKKCNYSVCMDFFNGYCMAEDEFYNICICQSTDLENENIEHSNFKQYGIYVNDTHVLIVLDPEEFNNKILTMNFTIKQFNELSNKCINETLIRPDGLSIINHKVDIVDLYNEFLNDIAYLGQITNDELLKKLKDIKGIFI